GNVYQQVIERVIQASQNDFEEFGVDHSTLDELKQVCGNIPEPRVRLPPLSLVAAAFQSFLPLWPTLSFLFGRFVSFIALLSLVSHRLGGMAAWRCEVCRTEDMLTSTQGWQDKLTALHVATFPWDPVPEPVRQPPTVPSNVKQEPDVVPPMPQQEHVNFPNIPTIKTERGYDQPISSYPQHPANGVYGGGFNGDIAAQRAQALVQQRMQQGQLPQMHQQLQHQQQQQQRMMQGQQQQRAPQQMPPRPAQGYNPSQTDGSDATLEDWRSFVAARRAAEANEGPEGRIAADQFMRAQVDAMAAQQDSGLMMPLDSMPKGRKRKAITRVLQAQQAEKSLSGPASQPPVASFDGEAEKEEPIEDPEDAINSDLDDPDDNGDEDNSDDETMDYMLCTYDKVQRVKNKWKCTLKDGILTTNKREYLFHKANGEFEW
ncbi:transcription factor IIA, alpha/beta subunit-domain-containing protein, partial [Lophiotrema nucula]